MTKPSTVHVGTAAWSIPTRYLDDIPAGASQLMRYAQVFSVVEIDSSFSRHHQAATYARWAQSVGEDFRFAVKVPRELTHDGALLIGENPSRSRFFAEVAGLGLKLAVLLVQLPPRLAFEEAAARNFFSDLHAAKPSPVAIACEPRHPSWASPAVDELLKDLQVSRVAADPGRCRSGSLG
ncbi:MAG TPA: DUF72 domain-containing protein [Steroidobacteraceae bacterium]|nr:DUF72 domain-containing protein [Steroidobacteraceae bacterium]